MAVDPTYSIRDVSVPADRAVRSDDPEQVGTFEYLVDRRQLDWSPAVSVMLGYSHDTVQPSVGLLLDHVPLEDRSRVAGVLERVVEGRSAGCRHRLVDCAGNLRWVVATANPTRDATNGVNLVSGLFIDITAAVHAETRAAVAELAKARGSIEQAKGVLRAAYGISADEAFDILVRRSQVTNTKLRDIAGQLIDKVSGGATSALRTRVEDILMAKSAAG